MTRALELTRVSKRFTLPDGAAVVVLDGVDLVIERGETVSVIGRSGSGKSTLLHLLGLLDDPDAGSYLFEGRPTAEKGDIERSRIRSEHFGFIFQQFHLLDGRSALENVAHPLLYRRGHIRRCRRALALDALERVGLADRAGSFPHQLSGGEQQRVAIARALVGRPRTILADEPTGSLDPDTGRSVLGLLRSLMAEDEITLVMVTHDDAVAAGAARILRLSDGRLRPVLA